MNGTVPTLTMAAMIVTAVFTLFGPLVALVIWRKKTKAKLQPALVGALIFIGFALILESIVHYLCLGLDTPLSKAITGNTILYGIYGGMMAGIFEETGRLVAFAVILKKWKEKSTAVTYGIGHGGVECMLITGLTYVSNLFYSFLINTGSLDTILQTVPESERNQAVSTLSVLITTPANQFLAGGFERFSAILLHIGLSILVFYAVREKKKRYLFPIAIFIHAAVDFTAVVLSASPMSIWMLEAVIFVFGALIFAFGVRLYRLDQIKPDQINPEQYENLES
ncbi:MAG: YhfC family intramembrane metalloprotease [Lachnospiraceae bacterium]